MLRRLSVLKYVWNRRIIYYSTERMMSTFIRKEVCKSARICVKRVGDGRGGQTRKLRKMLQKARGNLRGDMKEYNLTKNLSFKRGPTKVYIFSCITASAAAPQIPLRRRMTDLNQL